MVLERLSLQDMTNLAVEAPDSPMHVGALGILDGGPLLDVDRHVRLEAARACIEARLDLVPELRRKLWRTRAFQGRPLWVDDPEFRIENHVLGAAIEPPGGDEQALAFANSVMATLMDRAHPLWQLWFLEGLRGGKVGAFLKLHHVLADGAAILNIVSLLFDLDPEVSALTPAAWTPAPPPATWLLYGDATLHKVALAADAWQRLLDPVGLARSTAQSVQGLWAALVAGLGTPHTSFNRPVGTSRNIGVIRIGLADAKNVAHVSGVKVNDVILNLVAGGMREVLMTRGELSGPANIRASMAVSRPSADRSAPTGNHSGTMIVPLPVHEDDARARLVTIGTNTARAKSRQQGALPQLFMVMLALSGLTRFFIRRQRLVNILVTNLPGPQFPLYVVGARLLDVFAITPVAGNVSASFAALSYDGHLDLSVHVDAACWPDLDVLLHGMNATWSEMSAQSKAA